MTRTAILPRTTSSRLWRKWALDVALEIRDALCGCNCRLTVWMRGQEVEYDAADERCGWTLVGRYDERAHMSEIADDLEATAQPEFA